MPIDVLLLLDGAADDTFRLAIDATDRVIVDGVAGDGAVEPKRDTATTTLAAADNDALCSWF
jgi:hypothetical protein